MLFRSAHGLWRDPRRLNHHKSQHWEGRASDGSTLAYASPWTLAHNPALCPLDFDLDLDLSLGLVVNTEHVQHPRIQELLTLLRDRVASFQPPRALASRAA